MDKRVIDTYLKVVNSDGSFAVTDYFESARIETMQLVEEIEPFNGVLDIHGLRTAEIDKSLISFAEKEIPVNVIEIEYEPRTTASDEAVEKLVNEQGKVLILIEKA